MMIAFDSHHLTSLRQWFDIIMAYDDYMSLDSGDLIKQQNKQPKAKHDVYADEFTALLEAFTQWRSDAADLTEFMKKKVIRIHEKKSNQF